MSTIYLDILEYLNCTDYSTVDFFIRKSELLGLSEVADFLFYTNFKEQTDLVEDCFLIFNREDIETCYLPEDYIARNWTEYKKWVISIPLNDSFFLQRTISLTNISNNFEVVNGSTKVINEDDKNYVLEVELNNGSLTTEIDIQENLQNFYIFLDIFNTEGKIDLTIDKHTLAGYKNIYHYQFRDKFESWRIMKLPFEEKNFDKLCFSFNGTGKFKLHILAIVKTENLLINPTEFSYTYTKEVPEVDNLTNKDKVYFVIANRTSKQEATAVWSILTKRQYNFIKQIFGKKILLYSHDFMLKPALFSEMGVSYLKTGEGVSLSAKLYLY